MSADNVFLVFFSLLVILLCSAEETQVSCVFNENCVLPCSVQSGSDPAIHWFKTPGYVPFHSYYNGQNQVFKDRTSLFVDQISRGNASLLLREVKGQDEGTYRCNTGTDTSDPKESFINLRVRASVSFVNIEQRGDELICSSKDIYPKPDVSWSLRPPPPDVEPKISVSVSEKGLYSIFSSAPLSHKPPEEHSCNISTDHSWSSATYRLQLQIISGNKVTVPCSASNSPIKSLVWKFNYIQTILTQTGTNRVYNEAWRQFVEEVSESGLTLKNLSSGHQGVYSCVFSSDRETLISDTIVRKEDPPSTTVYIVVGVLLFFLFIIIIILVLFYRWKRQKELQHLRKEKRKKQIITGFIQMLIKELDPEDELVTLRKLSPDSKNELQKLLGELDPKDELVTLRKLSPDSKNHRQKLEDVICSMQLSYEKLKLKDELASLRTIIHDSMNEKQELIDELVSLEKKICDGKNEPQELKDELESLRDIINRNKDKLQKLIKDLDPARKKILENINELQKKEDKRRSENPFDPQKEAESIIINL